MAKKEDAPIRLRLTFKSGAQEEILVSEWTMKGLSGKAYE